eukprot:scaffold31216_cov14-Tisochrysis_lutea.AAC.1
MEPPGELSTALLGLQVRACVQVRVCIGVRRFKSCKCTSALLPAFHHKSPHRREAFNPNLGMLKYDGTGSLRPYLNPLYL